MSTRLVILGLLQDRPLHGYEIKHVIEDHMGDWTSIAFGSIYFALKKLTEEGMIEVAATERAGNRPSRTVYAVTDAGREEFLRLLRELWGHVERHYFAIDLGLFFADALPREEVAGFIDLRIEELRETLAYLAKHREESLADPHVPGRARFIFDHSREHLEAELAWTQALRAELRARGPLDGKGEPG
jgi:DNA-binding PadR family transcriptional regulator